MLRVVSLALALALPASALAQSDSGYGEIIETHAVTSAMEFELGRKAIELQIWMNGGEFQDEAQQARVEQIIRRVIAHSDKPNMVWSVRLVQNPEINAAAGFGGFMFVTKGALESFSDDELAFVLAHEVSHAQLRHMAGTVNLNDAASMLDAALKVAEAGGDPSVKNEVVQGMQMMLLQHKRRAEFEADAYGLMYAVRAGYSPSAGISSMEVLREHYGDSDPLSALFQDHPTISSRIEGLSKMHEQILANYHAFETGEHQMQTGRYGDAADSFKRFLVVFPNSPAGWNNLAAAYLRLEEASSDDPLADDIPLRSLDVKAKGSGFLEAARDAAMKALEIDPNSGATLVMLGAIARRDGKYTEARAFVNKALEVWPNNGGALNNLANIEVSAGNFKEAKKLYKEAAREYAPMVDYNVAVMWELMGKKKKADKLYDDLLWHPTYGKRALARMGSGSLPAVETPAGPALGGVTIGMDFDDVIEKLGEPDQHFVEDSAMGYAQWFGPDQIVVGYTDDKVDYAGIEGYSGVKTGEGVGLGSGIVDVVGAYGQPDEIGGMRLGQILIFNAQYLRRGVSFGTFNDSVTAIELFPPQSE